LSRLIRSLLAFGQPFPTRLSAISRKCPGWSFGSISNSKTDLGSPVLYLGGELVAGEGDLFFVRAGYGQQQSGQSAGASVGLGLRYEQFDLGLAKRLSGSSLTGESEPVHISFGVVF
jgi:hypothetical protein